MIKKRLNYLIALTTFATLTSCMNNTDSTESNHSVYSAAEISLTSSETIKPSETEKPIAEQETVVDQENVVTETSLSREENEPFMPSTDYSVMSEMFPDVSFSASEWDELCAYTIVNENNPLFFTDDMNSDVFETYSELDELGRCGTAYANVCKKIMPTEERGKIGMVKPSGWQTSKYDKSVISDMYLYNRCHLIAFMLAGENANEKNLITGTRYLNVEGMLPFEDKVHDYIESNPKNHVLYRVTPVYKGTDLVAQGVFMEALSVEDNGEFKFCVYCYNVQPSIEIDYSNGNNRLKEEPSQAVQTTAAKKKPKKTSTTTTTAATTTTTTTTTVTTTTQTEPIQIETKTQSYVLNTNTKKIHYPNCSSVKDIKESNKAYSDKSVNELISEGYSPCKKCNPI